MRRSSLLKDLGVPPRDAQIILGRAHLTTTQQICNHVDEAARLDAITKISRSCGRASVEPAGDACCFSEPGGGGAARAGVPDEGHASVRTECDRCGVARRTGRSGASLPGEPRSVAGCAGAVNQENAPGGFSGR